MGHLCGFSLCCYCKEYLVSIPCVFLWKAHVRVSWGTYQGVWLLVGGSLNSTPPLSLKLASLGREGKEASPASTLGPPVEKPPEVSENRAPKWKTNNRNQVVWAALSLFPRDPPDRQQGLHQKILTAFNEYSQGFIKHFPRVLNKTVFKPQAINKKGRRNITGMMCTS